MLMTIRDGTGVELFRAFSVCDKGPNEFRDNWAVVVNLLIPGSDGGWTQTFEIACESEQDAKTYRDEVISLANEAKGRKLSGLNLMFANTGD